MMGKKNRKYIHVVLGSVFVVFVVYFSGFNIRNFVSLDGYVYSDEMRTTTSVYYSLASNRSSISGPLFSLIDRTFYKYIFENKTAFTLRPPSYVDFNEADVEVVFRPLRQIDLDVEVRTNQDQYLPKRLYSYDLSNLQHLPGFNQYIFDTHTVLTKKAGLDTKVPLKEALTQMQDGNMMVYTNDIDVQNSLYTFDIEKSFSKKIPLRGKHSLLTYSDGRPISFEMDYVDINTKSGPDRLNLRIKKNGKILEYIQFADDGNESDDQIVSKIQKAKIELEDLEEGIYEIELDNSDDIVSTSVSMSTQHLVAKGIAHLAPSFLENSFDNFEVYFNGSGLDIEGVENNSEFSFLSIDPKKGLKKLADVGGDSVINLEEGQYLSFTDDSFLHLDSIQFVDRMERAKADYIIVQNDNAAPADRNGWITSHVTFSKDEIFMSNGEIPLCFVVDGDNPLYFIDSIKTTLR